MHDLISRLHTACFIAVVSREAQQSREQVGLETTEVGAAEENTCSPVSDSVPR